MSSALSLEYSAVHVSGRPRRAKIGFMVLSLCLAVYSLFCSPSSASAYGGVGDYYYGSGGINSGSVTVNSSTTPCRVNGYRLQCRIPLNGSKVISRLSIGTQFDVPSNSVMRFSIIFRSNNYPNFSPSPLLVGYGWNILSQDWTIVDPNTAYVTVEVLRTNAGSYNFLEFAFNGGILVTPMTAGDSLLISFSNYTYSTQIDAGWYVDQISKIDSINNYAKQIATGGIKATVDMSSTNTAINNAAAQAHKDSLAQVNASNGTTDAVNKQTDELHKQYEQDKQEEAHREEQGKGDMNEATGIFNFNLLNPFAGIFGLFKPPNTCANIPTIARWVHSDSSTVCSWWSADVTSVLTPVFGMSSMMIVFGFLVSWLGSGRSDGSVDIGLNNRHHEVS